MLRGGHMQPQGLEDEDDFTLEQIREKIQHPGQSTSGALDEESDEAVFAELFRENEPEPPVIAQPAAQPAIHGYPVHSMSHEQQLQQQPTMQTSSMEMQYHQPEATSSTAYQAQMGNYTSVYPTQQQTQHQPQPTTVQQGYAYYQQSAYPVADSTASMVSQQTMNGMDGSSSQMQYTTAATQMQPMMEVPNQQMSHDILPEDQYGQQMQAQQQQLQMQQQQQQQLQQQQLQQQQLQQQQLQQQQLQQQRLQQQRLLQQRRQQQQQQLQQQQLQRQQQLQLQQQQQMQHQQQQYAHMTAGYSSQVIEQQPHTSEQMEYSQYPVQQGMMTTPRSQTVTMQQSTGQQAQMTSQGYSGIPSTSQRYRMVSVPASVLQRTLSQGTTPSHSAVYQTVDGSAHQYVVQQPSQSNQRLLLSPNRVYHVQTMPDGYTVCQAARPAVQQPNQHPVQQQQQAPQQSTSQHPSTATRVLPTAHHQISNGQQMMTQGYSQESPQQTYGYGVQYKQRYAVQPTNEEMPVLNAYSPLEGAHPVPQSATPAYSHLHQVPSQSPASYHSQPVTPHVSQPPVISQNQMNTPYNVATTSANTAPRLSSSSESSCALMGSPLKSPYTPTVHDRSTEATEQTHKATAEVIAEVPSSTQYQTIETKTVVEQKPVMASQPPEVNGAQISSEHCYNQILRPPAAATVVTITTTQPQRTPQLQANPERVKVKKVNKAKDSALKRIASPEGWLKMSSWLQKAVDAKDKTKISELLKQIIQSNVPVAVVVESGANTPKLIRSLSKDGPSKSIRQLAADFVARYKRLVKEYQEEEKVKSKEAKLKPKPEASKTKDDSTANAPKDVRTKENTGDFEDSPGSPELGEGIDEAVTLSHVDDEPEERTVESKGTDKDSGKSEVPKTEENKKTDENSRKSEVTKAVDPNKVRRKARVYQSKGRSTGLEGDEEELKQDSPVEDVKKKVLEEMSTEESKKPTKPKGDTSLKESSKEKTKKSSEKAAKPAEVVVKKEKAPATAKRTLITSSNSFMDALGPAEPAIIKKKPKRPLVPPPKKIGDKSKEKKSEEKPKTKTPIPVVPNEQPMEVILEGLFSEIKRKSPSPPPPDVPVDVASVAPTASVEHSADPEVRAPTPTKMHSEIDDAVEDIEVWPTKRITFADQRGLELVNVRVYQRDDPDAYIGSFEADELNDLVNMLDGEKSAQQNTPTPSSSYAVSRAKPNDIRWRLRTVANYHPAFSHKQKLAGVVHRTDEQIAESDRQQITLGVLYLGRATNMDPEEPSWANRGPSLHHVPKVIPLDPVASPEREPSPGPSPTFNEVSPPVASEYHATMAVPDAPVQIPVEPVSAAKLVSTLPANLQNLLAGLKNSGIVSSSNSSHPPTHSTYAQSIPQSQPPHPIASQNEGNRMPSKPPPTYQQVEPNHGGYHKDATPHGYQGQMASRDRDHHGGYGGGDGGSSHYNPPPPHYNRRVCHFLNTPRGCTFGDRCKFSHDIDNSGAGPATHSSGSRGARNGPYTRPSHSSGSGYSGNNGSSSYNRYHGGSRDAPYRGGRGGY